MVVEELITLIKAEVDPASVSKIENFAAGMDAAIWGVVGAILAIPAAVAGASVALAGIGTKMAADMEMTTAEITTMMGGNAQMAKGLIGDIQQFANVTPFETAPLVENAKTMMSMGIQAKDTVRYMKLIGDVAGGNQEKMSRFVYNFSQIKSLGKLQGEDLRQFATGGFNPLKALIEDKSGKRFTNDELMEKVKAGTMSMETFKLVSGKTTAQLQELSSKGKIGFQQMVDAFQMATAKGGLFYGNLERMSQTVQGRYSTFMDLVKSNLRAVGEKFLPLVGRWLDTISGVMEYIGPYWVEVMDAMRVFFQVMSDDSIESWGETIRIMLETLIGTTASLIYSFVFLFYFLKTGLRELVIVLTEPLRLLGKALWEMLISPLEVVIATAELAARAIGKTALANKLDSALTQMDNFKGRMTSTVDSVFASVGNSEDGLADDMRKTNYAWQQMWRDYSPRPSKPASLNQFNTINQDIKIDPKADPSGKTSLHMKGLKEAVRSAFNIEVMHILENGRA